MFSWTLTLKRTRYLYEKLSLLIFFFISKQIAAFIIQTVLVIVAFVLLIFSVSWLDPLPLLLTLTIARFTVNLRKLHFYGIWRFVTLFAEFANGLLLSQFTFCSNLFLLFRYDWCMEQDLQIWGSIRLVSWFLGEHIPNCVRSVLHLNIRRCSTCPDPLWCWHKSEVSCSWWLCITCWADYCCPFWCAQSALNGSWSCELWKRE